MIVFVLSVFVLSFTAIILPAVFTWITVKEAADKAYNKGYQKGYSRALNEGYQKGLEEGKINDMNASN